MYTYSGLNDDISDSGVVQSLEGRCSLSVSNSSQDDTLVEVDSVVCDVTGNGQSYHWTVERTRY